jgi:orotidine-5'-phosphate decarboxylase
MLPIFLAIDTPNYNLAHDLISQVPADIDLKFGLTFVTANDLDLCDHLARLGVFPRRRRLFLDMKYHDIPNTVAEAVRAAIQRIEPDFITLHTCDGVVPLAAATAVANECELLGFRRPKLLGVTILTSNKQNTSLLLYQAESAFAAGLDGLICPAEEIAALRLLYRIRWPDMFLMVPGIRMAGSNAHDQRQVATARQAMEQGADAVVIGRAITDSPDPVRTIAYIRETLVSEPLLH